MQHTHRVFVNHEEQTHVVCGKKDRTGDAVLSGTVMQETQIRTATSSLRGSSTGIKVDSCLCWRKEFQGGRVVMKQQISAQRLIGRYLGGDG